MSSAASRCRCSRVGPVSLLGADGGATSFAYTRPQRLTQEQDSLLQTSADFAALALLAPGHLAPEEMAGRIEEAVAGGVVIEQAKGVLAYRENLDMSAAYDRLLAVAAQSSSSLTAAAPQVLRDARRDRATS